MSFSLTITEKAGYLHAVVSGTNSEQNVKHYLEQIRLECARRQCRRILIEERLEGPRLGTWDVYWIVSEGSERARGQLTAIAYVDVNAKDGSMKFAEDVAINRALRLAVCSSVAEAEQWLMNDSRT